SLSGSSARAGPPVISIASIAIAQSQVLTSLFFPFSFVVPFMTNLLGLILAPCRSTGHAMGKSGGDSQKFLMVTGSYVFVGTARAAGGASRNEAKMAWLPCKAAVGRFSGHVPEWDGSVWTAETKRPA